MPQNPRDQTTSHITFLKASRQLPTKVHTFTANGWKPQGYPSIATWTSRTVEVGDIFDIERELNAAAPQEIVIRGKDREPERVGVRAPRNLDIYGYGTTRNSARGGQHPLHWAMIDIDGQAIAGEYDIIEDNTEDIVDRVIAEMLPDCFHDVTCIWELSSSAGIKKGISLHIWFWFDRPLTGALLAKYFKQHAPAVDTSVINNDVQPHYITPPVFIGGEDPIQTPRRGLLEREADHVTFPDYDPTTVANKRALRKTPSGQIANAKNSQAALKIIREQAGKNTSMHELVRKATWLGVKEGLDDLTIREAVREAVHSTLKDVTVWKGSREDEDAYMDQLLSRPREEYEALRRDYPSGYSAPSGSLREAQRDVKAGMEAFRRTVRAYHRDVAAEKAAAKPTPVVEPTQSETAARAQTLQRAEREGRERAQAQARAQARAPRQYTCTSCGSTKIFRKDKIPKTIPSQCPKCASVEQPRRMVS